MEIELVHITNTGCCLGRLELLKDSSFALLKAALSQLSVRFLKACMCSKDCPSVLQPGQGRVPSFSCLKLPVGYPHGANSASDFLALPWPRLIRARLQREVSGTTPQQDGIDLLGVGGLGMAKLKVDSLCHAIKSWVLALDGLTKQLPRKGQRSLSAHSMCGCQAGVNTKAGGHCKVAASATPRCKVDITINSSTSGLHVSVRQ